MTTILEPIGAGIIVALINKFIINNNMLWGYCKTVETVDTEFEDDISNSSVSASNTMEFHAHF